jgi:hypothetical protein
MPRVVSESSVESLGVTAKAWLAGPAREEEDV